MWCARRETKRRLGLVIEADLIVAWAIDEVLRSAGFGGVVVAPTEEATLNAARLQTFDLIVVDVEMKTRAGNGLSLLYAIDPDGRTPTIIHSAASRREILAPAGKHRNLTWIVKPCGEDVLFDAVCRALCNGDAVQPLDHVSE